MLGDTAIFSKIGGHIGFKPKWPTTMATNKLCNVYWLFISQIGGIKSIVNSKGLFQIRFLVILAAILEFGGHIEFEAKFKMAPELILKSMSQTTRIH